MHTRAGVAMSCLEEGFLPLNQISRRFFNRVTHHDFGGIALDLAERERIIADPGSCPVMVPRNHGLIAAGRSAPEMYNNMFHLGRACEIQITALGRDTDASAAGAVAAFGPAGRGDPYLRRGWHPSGHLRRPGCARWPCLAHRHPVHHLPQYGRYPGLGRNRPQAGADLRQAEPLGSSLKGLCRACGPAGRLCGSGWMQLVPVQIGIGP